MKKKYYQDINNLKLHNFLSKQHNFHSTFNKFTYLTSPRTSNFQIPNIILKKKIIYITSTKESSNETNFLQISRFFNYFKKRKKTCKTNLRKPQARPSSPKRTATRVLSIIPPILHLESVQYRGKISSGSSLLGSVIQTPRPEESAAHGWIGKIGKYRPVGTIQRGDPSNGDERTGCNRLEGVVRLFVLPESKESLSLSVRTFPVSARVGDQRRLRGSFEFECAFRTEPSRRIRGVLSTNPARIGQRRETREIEGEMEPLQGVRVGGSKRETGDRRIITGWQGGVSTRAGPDPDTFRVTRYVAYVTPRARVSFSSSFLFLIFRIPEEIV